MAEEKKEWLFPEWVGDKQLITADDYTFEIRKITRDEVHRGYRVYVSHKSWNYENMLCEKWTVSECKDWIFSHFIGRKGTKFNIDIVE